MVSVLQSRHDVRRPRPRVVFPDQQTSLTFSTTPKAYHQWKNGFDRVLAGFLLIPGMAIIGFLVLVVRLTSRGPGIYRQQRTGLRGRTFTMLKIRTMTCDAEAKTGAVWTQKDDARVTRLGRVLRKLHLDEFPQLFNVVRGDMSLIGPRPERPEFVAVLEKALPGYVDRLVVRPGITGLAQINLPPDTTVDDVRRKLILDLVYITEAGPWLDLRTLFCTVIRAMGIPGELVMRMFGLRRDCRNYCRRDVCCGVDGAQTGQDVMTPAKIQALRMSANGSNGHDKDKAKAKDPTRAHPKPR